MPAYIIARVQVTDSERYKEYTKLTPEAIKRYGGRFIVRGGEVVTLAPDTNNMIQSGLVFWRLAALLARHRSLGICSSLAPCHPPKSRRHLVSCYSCTVPLEGPTETRRVVVIEFPTLEQARIFYSSPEYTGARKVRAGAAEGQFIAVEGVA